MKKHISISVCIISLIFLLSSCTDKTENKKVDNTSKNQTNVSKSSDIITIEDIKNPQIIEEEKHYILLQGDGNYYYYIYDDDKEVVKEGGFYWRKPNISMVNNNIVKFYTQAGTGISTATSFYYNVEKDVLSRWFNSVYDETDELLVFSDHKKIIVRNIFDKTAYYREFTKFNNELSDVVEPFVNAEFINNNKQIKVTHLTGKDLKEITEIINL